MQNSLKSIFMSKEDFIIKPFLNKFNGDDGAVLGKWCFSKDLFCEDVHFKREWMNLEQIAMKAMLVNISDALVMNAVPKYVLLGLALPNLSEVELKALQNGFLKTAKKFGMKIIGGDTVESDKISISITIIAKVQKRVIYRKGLRKGHILAFTGELGESLRGLRLLQMGKKLKSNHRFIKPCLKMNFFYEAAPFMSCAMDISDGLSKDLSRLLKLNKLGVSWLKNLNDDELYSGEEYEILFGFEAKNQKKIEKIAKKHKIKLNIFAKAVKGQYEFRGKEHHF